MSPCESILDRLEAAVAETLPPELAAHLDACPICRMAVERARGLDEGGRALQAVKAPEALKQRLKALLRLQPSCEAAVDAMGDALDGEIAEERRAELVEHLHACPACRTVWESFATLREVGRGARAGGRFRAALALPPRQRIDLRRRQKRFFDLRLATAAAYILAAATVVLLSNPATVARASNEGMDKAAVYAKAAVENRVSSYSERIRDALTSAEGWARDRALDVWSSARGIFGGKRANQKAPSGVVESGKEKRP